MVQHMERLCLAWLVLHLGKARAGQDELWGQAVSSLGTQSSPTLICGQYVCTAWAFVSYFQ